MRQHFRGQDIKLPRVHRINRRGVVYKYHRRTRVELPNDVSEGNPIFVAAWTTEEAKTRKADASAKAREARTVKGSIAECCEIYLGSGAYSGLSESYRPVIRRHVEAIKLQSSRALLRDLRFHHINADLDPLTPAVAKSRLKAWRKLGKFWHAQGMIESDVAKAATGKPMPKTEGHKEWTHSDVLRFRKYWPLKSSQRLAFELLQWTGVRCVDAVRIGRGMVDSHGLLTFTQKKTGVEAFVPWLGPALGLEEERKYIRKLTDSSPHLVFVTTQAGKPRSHKAFSSWFSKSATAAGLPYLSAHGLRKYRMNRLAEHGASVLQMQAWVGHATLSEIENYTRKAEKRAAFDRTEGDRNVVKHERPTRKHR